MLGVFTDRSATAAALILGAAFPKPCSIVASHADGGCLTTGNLLAIRGLIVFLAVGTKIIGEAFLIVIVVGKMGIQAGLESCQVHRIGVEHILIDFIPVIPRLRDMNLVSIRLGILTALFLAQNICQAVIVDGIVETIVVVIQLLYAATALSCMVLRVLQCSLSFATIGPVVGIHGIDTIPMIAIEDAIVIGGRGIVAKRNATLVNSVDIPALSVVLSHPFTGIVSKP